jgi:hypothetical protein
MFTVRAIIECEVVVVSVLDADVAVDLVVFEHAAETIKTSVNIAKVTTLIFHRFNIILFIYLISLDVGSNQ